jgi:hypothetical protein
MKSNIFQIATLNFTTEAWLAARDIKMQYDHHTKASIGMAAVSLCQTEKRQNFQFFWSFVQQSQC